jgi:biotin carboxyl carrier protein
MSFISSRSLLLAAPAALALVLAGCGGSSEPSPPTAGDPDAAPVTELTEPVTAEEIAADEVAVREAELARREAELALQEREAELARREAELAAKQRAASAAPAAPRPAATAPAAATPAPAPAPKPVAQPIIVPVGTQLSVEFASTVTTKTAKVGDPIDARLAAPLVVGDRTVATAGAAVQGVVTEVYSGSQEIGGTPKLGIGFNRMTLENGESVPIAGDIVQQGKRESSRDAAKIAGGAIIGAVIGHQVDSGGAGRVIGGVLGGAAGAGIAKQTGGDLEVPAGTVIGFVLTAPIEMK